MVDSKKIQELLNQGLTHYGLGEVQKALDCWQQVLQLDPQNVRAREYIDFVHMSWGPRERERDMYEKKPSSYNPVASSNSSPPPASIPKPAAETASVSSSAHEKSVLSPQPAVTGWADLFADGMDSEETVEANTPPPAKSEPSSYAEKEQPRVAVVGASTLPPHPPEPLVYHEEPAVDTNDGYEQGTFARPTVPYQVVPTLVGIKAPAGSGGDVMDLIAPSSSEESVFDQPSLDQLLRGAEDLMQLNDFSGAIELLDKILEVQPQHPKATELRREAVAQLGAMLRSKIGPLDRIPRISMKSEDIIWLNLDHRAGFLLSLIDGLTSYEDIMSVCGLEEIDALRIFAKLLQDKVIEST